MKKETRIMSKENKRFEESIANIPGEISEEHMSEIFKNPESLRDVSLETRKKEAEQLIYLARYE